ncbi:elongation of very long chain fatty acids protein AAEL008004 [Tetranychus urticae]|uniref:Elongation of very long chain fatty acids protein n=1 Tax=Tetranychus urticae TaxID=32264 RepID=T1K290_TETUR|nr:elongation of very long chain fatty acids protein AAEL008004 [Tetranychus urticae]
MATAGTTINASKSFMDTTFYYFHDFWEEKGDPRVSSLPLMYGGPWKVILISFLYWYFVRILGPALMKGREPFDLRSVMLLHNSFLIGVNGVGFFVALWVTDMFKETWNCGPVDPNTSNLKDNLTVYLGYIYFLTKIVDFGDTIFFVLRKRFHQASFLHVFHHGVMPIVGFVGLKFHPGGYSGFLPTINILIHAIMYAYYALACAGPEMKKYLWWKKHITQLQMVQFVLTFFHAFNAIVNPNCHWPLVLAYLEALHAVLFFFLFASFYQKAYGSSSASSTSSPPVSSTSKQSIAAHSKSE